MTESTSRERVLRTFRFQETDRTPYDLMESFVWTELQQWCAANLGLHDKESVWNHFGLDFRWFWPSFDPPKGFDIEDPRHTLPGTTSYSDHASLRPLAGVHSIEELLREHEWMDPGWWTLDPVHSFRARYPDQAIVLFMPWVHPFMLACEFFGIEETLVRLHTEDPVLGAFLQRQNEFIVESLHRAGREAQGAVDICWLMDDVATQRSLMMDPSCWRRHLKGLLRRQVETLHRYGILALFHSCGAIRRILPDLIEIGVDGVLPFQTTADGMDVESIAREFGGRIAFYGGIDIQHLLTHGTEQEVRGEVRRNIDAFAGCGGYIVANSHHSLADLSSRNLAVMLEEARSYRPARG